MMVPKTGNKHVLVRFQNVSKARGTPGDSPRNRTSGGESDAARYMFVVEGEPTMPFSTWVRGLPLAALVFSAPPNPLANTPPAGVRESLVDRDTSLAAVVTV